MSHGYPDLFDKRRKKDHVSLAIEKPYSFAKNESSKKNGTRVLSNMVIRT
jgi:hypothetical protein